MLSGREKPRRSQGIPGCSMCLLTNSWDYNSSKWKCLSCLWTNSVGPEKDVRFSRFLAASSCNTCCPTTGAMWYRSYYWWLPHATANIDKIVSLELWAWLFYLGSLFATRACCQSRKSLEEPISCKQQHGHLQHLTAILSFFPGNCSVVGGRARILVVTRCIMLHDASVLAVGIAWSLVRKKSGSIVPVGCSTSRWSTLALVPSWPMRCHDKCPWVDHIEKSSVNDHSTWISCHLSFQNSQMYIRYRITYCSTDWCQEYSKTLSWYSSCRWNTVKLSHMSWVKTDCLCTVKCLVTRIPGGKAAHRDQLWLAEIWGDKEMLNFHAV